MADYFYTPEATDTDLVSSQSNLSTGYTAALSSYLQGTAADYIGYLAYTGGQTLEAALAIVEAVAAGQFTLADLFSAAQTKTAFADADAFESTIADAHPTLTVNGVTVDLTAILSDPDVAYWLTTTKKDGTIYHLREFYTAASEPEGYTEGWSDVQNVAPAAVVFTDTATEWNVKDDGAPEGEAAMKSIDLLNGVAFDADGDAINVVATTVAVNGILLANAGDLFTLVDNTLNIDTNSAYFNLLFNGQTTELSVTYQITDGIEGHEVDSSGTVTVTGTADRFSIGDEDTTAATKLVTSFNIATFDGNFSVTIDPTLLVAGADACFDFTGTADVTAVGDLNGTSEFIRFDIEFDTVDSETMSFTLTGAGPSTAGTGGDLSTLATLDGSSNFISTDSNVDVVYDSNFVNGAGGVDAMTSITVELVGVQYWA